MATEKQIVSELIKKFPNVYEQIFLGIQEIPKPYYFMHLLPEMVNSYCYHKGIEVTHLTNNLKGQKAQARARQDFYAVFLYIINPMKLYGLSDSPNPAMMEALSNHFADDYKNVSFHLRSAINLFSVDNSFREITTNFANLVIQDILTFVN